MNGNDLFNEGVMNQRIVAHWFANLKRTGERVSTDSARKVDLFLGLHTVMPQCIFISNRHFVDDPLSPALC